MLAQALESGEAVRNNIRLVVVDSIAALVRHEMDRHVADKQQLLGELDCGTSMLLPVVRCASGYAALWKQACTPPQNIE